MIFLIYLIVFIAVCTLSYLLIDLILKGYYQYRDRYILFTSQSLDQMFLFYSPEQIVNMSLIATVLLAAIGFIISFNIIVAVLFAVLGFFLPKIIIHILKKKRLQKFNEQLVPALDSIANSFSAGFTLLQAMDLVAEEQPRPLCEEFRLLIQEHKLGRHLDEALQNMADRVGSDDLNLVVNSLVIARSLGGNLTEMLQTIAHTIRERNRLEGKIKALTAQGKLQGIIVGAMPIFLLVVISAMEPEKMQYFFKHWIGWMMMGGVVILEVIGALFIRKIINIDV